MLISLHKNATTTPATRLAIQQAHGTEAELAQRFGVGKLTIRKGRKRTSVEDGCPPSPPADHAQRRPGRDRRLRP